VKVFLFLKNNNPLFIYTSLKAGCDEAKLNYQTVRRYVVKNKKFIKVVEGVMFVVEKMEVNQIVGRGRKKFK
jgi:hypothetical protein|tara:strand:+ start:9668 stop:9883 length:216 start_codon:yes stop_codon:yes gene_type:complete